MRDQLAILEKLEKLRSLKSQMALADLQREEARLREQLNRLNEHRRQSHATDPGLVPMRAIGADVLWQAWFDRTQADLTAELARVLVRKEPIARKAKVDLARKDTVTELTVQADLTRKTERNSKHLETVLQMATVTEALRRQS